MFRLEGRVALVTGAARGIGRGIAEALVRQGAAVVVNDLDTDGAEETAERLRAEGGSAFAAAFDVTDYGACERGVQAGESALGPLDILVNNAGGTPGGMWPTPFLDTPRETWSKFLGMNLEGTLNCTRIVAEGMADRGFGRIVSISSDAARVGNPGSSIYGAAKAGVEGLMRNLSKELGRQGVTANSIVLGLIDTVQPAFLERLDTTRLYAVPRIGTAEDVAAGVVYLVSDEAAWVSGHSLVINGGG